MFKALFFLLSPIASAGLVFLFGLPVLLACAGLVVATLMFSAGRECDEAEEARSRTGDHTTFLAGL
jgi:hypothetical protein